MFEVFLTPAYDDGNLIERKRALELLLLTKRYTYLKGYWSCLLAVCPV